MFSPDLALRVAALSQLRAIRSKLSQGSTGRIIGKQKRIAKKKKKEEEEEEEKKSPRSKDFCLDIILFEITQLCF